MNAIRMLILALTLCIGFCLATQAHAFDLFRFLDADDAQTMGNPLAISNEPTYRGGNPLAISNEPVYRGGNPLAISNEPTYLGGVRKSVPAAPTLR
ncbi:hypothetical protein [Desulfolutivibrio sulfoxidireducens]|uniref:hypothetical protein n=1 Tax=Desulfolutivibrio sulfoxidireducens TaxID=2773299 RepID=UPI00159E7BE7|nr:hypothetical protein [Desulfolutivibrio sulfoxidireducens]QLA16243.1 hypothetical protein GD605_08975 [Desulfolutivibrio sulfoxidireducens]QLA19864.1 hypothetical protein GD604_09005 [Desulfolutivibrio sulfoxidireducens]